MRLNFKTNTEYKKAAHLLPRNQGTGLLLGSLSVFCRTALAEYPDAVYKACNSRDSCDFIIVQKPVYPQPWETELYAWARKNRREWTQITRDFRLFP